MILNYILAVIYGVAQGATEFLPISSSGHLVLLHDLWPLPLANELAFDVWLHLATLGAVVYFLRSDIVKLVMAWLDSFRGRGSEEGKMAWLIIIGSVPAALAAFLFGGQIEEIFRSPVVVAIMLAVVGALFILVERFGRQSSELSGMTVGKTIAIGLAQAIALIPGTSRSGITIIAGMSMNLKRHAAVRFSFLLSIPIIAGASFVKLPDLLQGEYFKNDWAILLIGFVAAFISAWFAIKWLVKFTAQNSLNIFAYYRFLLAAVILVLYFWL